MAIVIPPPFVASPMTRPPAVIALSTGALTLRAELTVLDVELTTIGNVVDGSSVTTAVPAFKLPPFTCTDVPRTVMGELLDTTAPVKFKLPVLG